MRLTTDCCEDCPFHEEGIHCGLAMHMRSGEYETFRNDDPLPRWCPLRTGPVTVVLKEADDG